MAHKVFALTAECRFFLFFFNAENLGLLNIPGTIPQIILNTQTYSILQYF